MKFDSADDHADYMHPRAAKINAWLSKPENYRRVLLDRISDIYEVLSPMARMKLHALMIFCYYDLPLSLCMRRWVRETSELIFDEGHEALMQADPDQIIKLCLIVDAKPVDIPEHIYLLIQEVAALIHAEMFDQEFVENTAVSMMGI